jgi:hypothetical protein
MTRTCAFLVVWLGFAAIRLFSAEPEWKVGLASVKVTPDKPVLLAGYANRTRPFESVAADIYCKAIVLEDREGHRAAIVTSDLLGFPADVAEPICTRIGQKIGLKRSQILLNSSHSHAGPQLMLKPPAKDNSGEAQRNVEYTRQLQDKVVELVSNAAEKMEPANLSWGTGVINFAMNRREFTPNGVILGVNPRGLADRSVPVLRIDGADGKLRAVLFGTAVHGTTLTGDNYQLCGDFAGYAQAALQERTPGAQALYMLGCAGDDNPYPRGTMVLTIRHGQSLAEEVGRVLETKLRPIHGPLTIAFDYAELPLQTGFSRADLEKISANRRDSRNFAATQMLAILDKGENLPATYRCPFTVWQFGQDLTLVGLPGEVVVDYVTMLEKALGPNQLWIAAYCNDVFGYLPSARVLTEGGYETRGLYSGSAGLFDPKAEQVVVQTVRELAKKAGRKLPE